jgi:hypothetical protein
VRETNSLREMQFLVKILIRTEFLPEPDISSFEVL